VTQNYEQVIYEKLGPVARVTFNRPEKLNAMNQIMNSELRQVFEDVQKDDSVRVLVLTGAGRAFSTGEDVNNIYRGSVAQRDRLSATGVKNVATPGPASPMPRLMHETVQKPIISAVNGVAAGAGYGMALASDFRFASTEARFAHIYLRRALVTSAETFWLPKLVGLGNALFHVLMADDIEADEAYRIGLVQKLLPPEKLMDETMSAAERIAAGPAVAQRFTKLAMERGLLSSYKETMEFVGWARSLAAGAGEVQEGSKAFLEKRAPNFMFDA
jgi:2-(1,2-epoxy-1,2-dihydrophenyl)acetyl-CoA isomerase